LLEEVQVQLNALKGIIVAGDGVGDDVRVAVGVHDSNCGDSDLCCIHNGLTRKFLLSLKYDFDVARIRKCVFLA